MIKDNPGLLGNNACEQAFAYENPPPYYANAKCGNGPGFDNPGSQFRIIAAPGFQISNDSAMQAHAVHKNKDNGHRKKRQHGQKTENSEPRQQHRFMWAARGHHHFVMTMRGHTVEPGRCRHCRARDKQGQADHEGNRRIAEDRAPILSGTELGKMPVKPGPYGALDGTDDERGKQGRKKRDSEIGQEGGITHHLLLA
ncbi:hypothetical protein, partial [Hyphomonas sp. UBA2660]|uniref:hypothetical protein n=3 Tax=unclassified Hyphomonas TaxID=2630699 RepID=UPI0025C597B8